VNGREVLPAGAIANQFQAHEDRPNNWDAWDVDIFLSDKKWLADPATSITVVEAGPLRATLAITRRILSSEYTQRISLQHNSAQVDITTDIDWRERNTFLKVAFPVDVLSPKATYEIQWGNTERPTHWNTSWDWARFETCAQKWVDLSEGGYGVSVLNDCKYGHDIKDNVIRISLLRGPGSPDPTGRSRQAHLQLQPAAPRRRLERGDGAGGLRAQRPADCAAGAWGAGRSQNPDRQGGASRRRRWWHATRRTW
jgi:alpha-mannosidase